MYCNALLGPRFHHSRRSVNCLQNESCVRVASARPSLRLQKRLAQFRQNLIKTHERFLMGSHIAQLDPAFR